MGQFRFVNGVALGPENNFAATSANVFSQGDATPDVTNGNLFFTNNASTTTITHFDLSAPGGGAGNNAGGFEGKVITIVMLDNSTNITSNARIAIANSSSITGLNTIVDFVYHNSSWIQRSVSVNQNGNFISVDSNSIKNGTTMYPNASTGNIVVTGLGDNITLNLLHDSTGPWALRRVIGSVPGTILNLICGGDSQALVIVNSAAADTFVCQSSASSTQFRLVTSAAISFVRGLSKWHEIGNVWSATNGTLST